MSNKLMKQCRLLPMSLVAKAVLMALADIADENGYCWPSLETLSEYTCASKRAVVNAIQYLEATKVLVADRSNGRKTTYTLTPEKFVPIVILSARTEARRKAATGAYAAPVAGEEAVHMPHGSDVETSADAAPVSDGKPVHMPHGSETGPVHLPHPTSAFAAPEPVHMPHEPVRHMHSNPQEPPLEPPDNHQQGGDDLFVDLENATGKSKKFDAMLIPLPDWLNRAAWCMWVADRNERKQPITQRAAKLQIRGLDKLRSEGFTPEAVIENAISSGYRGLFRPSGQRSPHGASRRQTSHNGLDTKNYSEGITDGFIP